MQSPATDPNALSKALIEPFPLNDIEWRVQRSGIKDGSPWISVTAYIDNRAIMERLDAVVGPANWRNEYKAAPAGSEGVLCGISICVTRPDGTTEWVTKWDGADYPAELGGEHGSAMRTKGGLSASMKRAAVQWGIGRYLYNLPEGWATIVADRREAYETSRVKGKNGDADQYVSWNPPALPLWALPGGAGHPGGEGNGSSAARSTTPAARGSNGSSKNGARETSSASTPPTRTESAPNAPMPLCPKCNGPCFTNVTENDARAARGEKLRPDYVCKNKKGCGGLIWRDDEKKSEKREPVAFGADGEPEYGEDEADDLPF